MLHAKRPYVSVWVAAVGIGLGWCHQTTFGESTSAPATQQSASDAALNAVSDAKRALSMAVADKAAALAKIAKQIDDTRNTLGSPGIAEQERQKASQSLMDLANQRARVEREQSENVAAHRTALAAAEDDCILAQMSVDKSLTPEQISQFVQSCPPDKLRADLAQLRGEERSRAEQRFGKVPAAEEAKTAAPLPANRPQPQAAAQPNSPRAPRSARRAVPNGVPSPAPASPALPAGYFPPEAITAINAAINGTPVPRHVAVEGVRQGEATDRELAVLATRQRQVDERAKAELLAQQQAEEAERRQAKENIDRFVSPWVQTASRELRIAADSPELKQTAIDVLGLALAYIQAEDDLAKTDELLVEARAALAIGDSMGAQIKNEQAKAFTAEAQAKISPTEAIWQKLQQRDNRMVWSVLRAASTWDRFSDSARKDLLADARKYVRLVN